MTTDTEKFHVKIWICDDCLVLQSTGSVIVDDCEDIGPIVAESIAKKWGVNTTIEPTGSVDDEEFSWWPCEACGAGYGGNRHGAVAIVRD